MRRLIATLLITTIMAITATGCGMTKKIPDDWYEDALDYYGNGIKNGFIEDRQEFNHCSELSDKGNNIGYLLTDLDGDGADELLIGIMDNDSHTKFTNVIVYHSDLGPYCLLSGGDGYYIYLCNGNVLKVDSWYGSQTKTDYMTYDHNDNAFTIVDGSKSLPKKFDLTPF